MTLSNKLYIPNTVVTGFQNREGTFTGKLGYVIYKDHTGKLRKEKSWNSWRDHAIDPLEFENTPQTGFTFNKGIVRGGYDWFSEQTTKVRVWDPRDFEFEISVGNLIALLMHSDVSKRDIQQPCVYAWSGTELVLLPINSDEYKESSKFTEKQKIKFSAKDLVVGHTYTLKKDNRDVVYLGRLDQYEIEYTYDDRVKDDDRMYSRCEYLPASATSIKKKSKGHVFAEGLHTFHVKDPSSFIAYTALQEVSPELPVLLDAYYAHIQSQPIGGLALVTNDEDIRPYYYSYETWYQLNETDFVQFNISSYRSYSEKDDVAFSRFARYNKDTNTVEFSHEGYKRDLRSWYNDHRLDTPARHLDGLDEKDPVIVTLMNELNEKCREINAEAKKITDYTERNVYERTVTYELYTKFNLGSLHPKMADGKVCVDKYF